jgi:hypothetical protein
MKHLGRQINFSAVRATSARMLLRSALPTGASLNLAERLPISSNHEESYCCWQQILTGQYGKISVN